MLLFRNKWPECALAGGRELPSVGKSCAHASEGEGTRASSGSPGLWGHLSPGTVGRESEEHEQPPQDDACDACGQEKV